MAGARVLPLRGDAYLREGKEDASSLATVGQSSSEEYSMYAKGFHPDKEALERGHRDWR